MDLGEYQHLSQSTHAPRPISRPEIKIKRKPVSNNSIELSSIHSHSSQRPLLDAQYEESAEPFGKGARKEQKWKWWKAGSGTRPAWVATVTLGLILAFIVLILNISLLAWSYSRFPVQEFTAVVFTGPCSKTSKITAVSEVAINIFSTLLLSASNNCAQLLISPTRTDVDRAHEKGVWIHVGPSDMRNFGWIGKWRVAVWTLLFLSSLPLHLLYNSVIYSSAYTSDWFAAAVTKDFLDVQTSWNQTSATELFTNIANPSYNDNAPQPYTTILSQMQNTSNLTKLTDSECQSAFGTTKVQSPYLNVIVVTNYTSNDSFFDGLLYYPEKGVDSALWFNKNASNITIPGCSQKWNYTKAPDWSLPECVCSENECSLEKAPVQECLAQSAGDFDVQCTISISLNLLIAVIVCNAIKGICFICTLSATTFHPLVTVGDAVASFMERPDSTTVACGPLNAAVVEDWGNIFLGIQGPWCEKVKHWKEVHAWGRQKKARIWGHTIRTAFGVGVAALMLVGWIWVMIMLSRSWNGDIASSWSHDVAFSVYSSGASTNSLAGNVLLVNTPQLAVSLIYVLYNSLLTRMLVTNELAQYGKHRKTLRVSRPQGAQRSTYWLTLPYRYILPLMTCMALIHFFIARGIYLINIKVYNISGQEVPYRAHFAHATSALALLVAFLLGTVLLLALVACIYRKLEQGMPVLGTNSVAISSACHAALGDENAAVKGLLYGAIDAPPVDDLGVDRGVMKHVCFSSFEVEPLEDGKSYY